jgi:hypothetical protein
MFNSPDPQDLADRMAPVAAELVRRVRTDPPMVLWRDLVAPLDGYEVAALVALLAAAVDPSVHPDVLWGWVRHREAIKRAAPIVWDEGQEPIEAMDSARVDALVRSMTGRRRSDEEIAEATGLTAGAVAKRRQRMSLAPGLRRGDVRTARAGVA